MATHTRNCEECGDAFTQDVPTGRPRRLCSDACRETRKASNYARNRADAKPCVVSGCANKSAYSSGVCNACYVRQWRGGDLLKKPQPTYRSVTSHGYVKLAGSGHPLAVRGYVYEHRQVLYDDIGPGPHPCFWCGLVVEWVKGKCGKGALVPDHLDGNKSNNKRSNLVPACNPCNAARGLFLSWVQKHKDDPVLWKMYLRARGAA